MANTPPVSEATRILDRAQQADPGAAEELLPLIYDELRKLAAHKLANEADAQTLQPTALVHEAWLRLLGGESRPWNGCGHFFAAAAEAMRRILIDRARHRLAQRRGGGAAHTELEGHDPAAPESDQRLLAVHEALERFEGIDRTAAELVKLRCFVGMSMREACEALGLPPRSADRLWAYARGWLRREMASHPNELPRSAPSTPPSGTAASMGEQAEPRE